MCGDSSQVGATPSFVEQAREHCSSIAKFSADNKPLTICPPEADPKWRFFWRIGQRPQDTKYENLNAAQVLPAKFPQWATTMDSWGDLMLQTVQSSAEMAAHGFNLPSDTFTSLMNFGPHLLAPTGSDLTRFGALNTVFANYHYDLNFLTIHGRSRFPGLYIWLRDGTKTAVKVPPNCLLLQAGIQFEWLTGGKVLAGFHEVVVTEGTLAALEKQRAKGRPLWRISSTLFAHIASDNILQPLPGFPQDAEKYPPTSAGVQVEEELKKIKLNARP